jgi:putative spermidine/putrescine transport system ATP-binding protein
MVFQNYALFPHMTVKENLEFPLEVRKMKKSVIDEKVSNALLMVELQDFGSRMPLQLSGGQQQRVALARSLVFEPRLVLMDEPLGALDKNLREQMQYEIKHIHEKIGITVVYVTHDQNEALTMSNRIAVFNDGKIQQISSPDVLYEKPNSSFVAQFIGENNQLKGKVKSVNGENCIITTESGDDIHALKINVNNSGDASLVSLRPERVAINSSEKFENNFDAKVKELIYLGDHIRSRVEVCGNDQFIVKIPNSYMGAKLKEGVTVKLSWKASDSRALDLN